MPIDGRWEKATIETGAGVPARTGGTVRTSVSTEAWTCWHPITARAAERYKSLDKNVEYRVELRSHHPLSLEASRIVRTSDSGRIYEPVGSPEVLGLIGRQSILVRWTGQRKRIVYGAVAITVRPHMAARAT
jgi:hypothetical protein